MKIIIDESSIYEDIEVIVKCNKCDDEVMTIISKLKSEREKIVGSIGEKSFVIEPRDILYFESVDKKSFIYTQKDVYETSLRLYEIEKDFKAQGFFRATKSTVINISKIKSIKTEFNGTLTLEMENGEKLKVSRQYAPILKERLSIV